MAQTSPLSGSLEDYLEAIYHLVKRDQEARSTQLAEMLHVKKSSVTVALRVLADKKMIHYTPYSNVTLTPLGEKAAEDVVRRHETLKDFLTQVLDIEAEKAESSACAMEHVLSKNITDKLNRLMEFIMTCPRAGKEWIDRFHQTCNQDAGQKPCVTCVGSIDRKGLSTWEKAGEALVGTLNELKPGQKAEIVKVSHQGTFRKRILEMGVTTGAVLEVERVAPLGDPIDIKIRGYHLSLRKAEAKNIVIRHLA